MKRALCLLLILSQFLIGCSASESQIATAIAKTQNAIPTMTTLPSETATPTIEPSITPTNTLVPTDTQEPSPTPTPDKQIVDIPSQYVLLLAKDLPPEDKYYLSGSQWTGHYTNAKFINEKKDEGKKQIDITGRKDGYWIVYFHGATSHLGPIGFSGDGEIFSSGEGAMIKLNKYSSCDNPLNAALPEYLDYQIGDISRACSYTDKENHLHYKIEFVYKNIFLSVDDWEWQENKDMIKEYCINAAKGLLARIQSYPLIEPK